MSTTVVVCSVDTSPTQVSDDQYNNARRISEDPEDLENYQYDLENDEWYVNRSQSELDAIKDYQGMSPTINESLRKGFNPAIAKEGVTSSSVDQMVANLDRALSEGNLVEDTIVYRGMDSEVISQMRPGTMFTDDAYMSTSISREEAFGYTHGGTAAGEDFMMEIFIPKGIGRGAYISTSDDIYGGAEYEYLLRRGSRLIVRGLDREAGVLRMELVPW